MILSEKFKFVFIKGRKVGGTSVEMALSTICGPRDIITPIASIDELKRLQMGYHSQNYAATRETELSYLDNIRRSELRDLPAVVVPKERYYNHMSLREVYDAHRDDLSGYDIVCVERSPYAKVLSWANWILSWDSYLAGGALQADRVPLRRCVDQIMESGEFITVRNIDLYRGVDGKVAARAMRYENLVKDMAAFLDGLGIEDLPPIPHAKKGLLSDRLDPREFLTKEQLGRINEAFSEEFSMFGYSMIY